MITRVIIIVIVVSTVVSVEAIKDRHMLFDWGNPCKMLRRSGTPFIVEIIRKHIVIQIKHVVFV